MMVGDIRGMMEDAYDRWLREQIKAGVPSAYSLENGNRVSNEWHGKRVL